MDTGKFTLSLIAIFIIMVFGIMTIVMFLLNNADTKKLTTPVTMGMRQISGDELMSHTTREDCWILIHGYVYDVTTYASRHPGEEVIFDGCGKDATDLFEKRWMGSGTPHSEEARQLLGKYKIGTMESTP